MLTLKTPVGFQLGFFFAPTSFNAFRLLSPVLQVYWVFRHEVFLAQRVAEGRGINLYHCADEGRGFFVEINLEETDEHFVVLRSFVRAEPLEDYSYYVQLPDLG